MTAKVEDFRSIDIAWLRRNGAKTVGYTGRIKWTRSQVERASIGYRIEPGGIRLQYSWVRGYGDPEPVDELIPIVLTPTRFGGYRHWFSCPSCRRRCRLLYGGDRFRCRHCWNAKYESQYEAKPLRICSRRWRLRRLLEERGGLVF